MSKYEYKVYKSEHSSLYYGMIYVDGFAVNRLIGTCTNIYGLTRFFTTLATKRRIRQMIRNGNDGRNDSFANAPIHKYGE